MCQAGSYHISYVSYVHESGDQFSTLATVGTFIILKLDSGDAAFRSMLAWFLGFQLFKYMMSSEACFSITLFRGNEEQCQ